MDPKTPTPRTPRSLRSLTLAALSLSLVAVVATPVRAEASRACTRAAKYFDKAKRVKSVNAARKLRTLHAVDPACVQAPEAAYRLLDKIFEQLKPPPVVRGSDRTAVEKEWLRFRNNAAFVQAAVDFRRARTRPQAMLRLGQLYEAMSRYLDEVGTSSGQTVVFREVPESLYHTRAVDLGEYMKIRAERSFENVVNMLTDASRENETLVAARGHLASLRERHDARARERAALEERRLERDKERADRETGGLPLP